MNCRGEVLTRINALLATVLLALPALMFADGQTIRLAGDSNSRLEVKEAIVAGDRTTVLFWTWPDRGDPGFSEECSKNYYTVELGRGLPSADPKPLAQGACAGISQLQGGLLSDGGGKFIVHDRLEHWQDGKRLSAKPLAELEGVGSLRLSSVDAGTQFMDFSPAGDLVMAVVVSGPAAQQWPGVSVVIAAIDPQGRKRWLHKVEKSDSTTSPERIWAGTGGSALLRYSSIDITGLAADSETALLHVSADGKRTELPLVIVAEPYDFMSIKPGSKEDLQKAFAHMEENRSEGLEALAARVREEGGFDVLFERDSDNPGRSGYFLLHVGPDGAVLSEQGLGTLLDDHGLQQWKDFYVVGNELVVLSTVSATQSGVNSRRKQWPQTALSRIDLASLQVETRLVPLERQYLEAAMNAGDAGQQYLEGQPGGAPVLLTSVGGTPVSVATGWVKKRGTLRIYEMTDDLLVFTEYRDQQLDKMAKEDRKQQKKAAREQMSQDMEAALGMSAEEFDSLSQEEQAMLMMQGGNMEAMMNSVLKQAQAARSEVQAAAFTVDALMRGHIRFRSDGGTAVTLRIIDRQGGEQLMRKEYPEGVIDEYLSLGTYQLPRDRIGARVTGPTGEVLADLSPEIR